MNNPIDLPSKINTIDVYSSQVELGVLTYGSIHHYQPIQASQHVSLTMIKKRHGRLFIRFTPPDILSKLA